MKFKDLVSSQTLTETEQVYFYEICKRWEDFSNTVGRMDKPGVLKVLKYLMDHRQKSTTLINRAIQRFNSLNKIKKSDLFNGGDE